MSATAGKIVVDGIFEGREQRTLALRFIQARDANLVNRPFQARFRDGAGWVTDLTVVDGTPEDLASAICMES
jgi:hypothetical protein